MQTCIQLAEPCLSPTSFFIHVYFSANSINVRIVLQYSVAGLYKYFYDHTVCAHKYVWYTRHSVEVESTDMADSSCASASAHLPLRVSEWEGTEYVPPVRSVRIVCICACAYVHTCRIRMKQELSVDAEMLCSALIYHPGAKPAKCVNVYFLSHDL